MLKPDKQFITSVALAQGPGHIFDAMSSDLIQKDKEKIWHPYTHQSDMPDPVGIVSGQGSWLQTESGKNILDAISSWWVNLHGHAHPYIAEKIYKQALILEQVIFAGFTHRPAVELADRLLPLLPGNMAKIFYSDNGSTAVEVALKMAIQYWSNNSSEENNSTKHNQSRKKILALKNSYHGDTFGAMSVSERGVFTLAFRDYLFEVIFIDTPDKQNLQVSLDLLETDGDDIACFIYEPMVQGAGGMKMMDAFSLNSILQKAKSKNILCIADEVMTGFGRTGKLFASEWIEPDPDIICLSKGLTGGTMAMGITACSSQVHSAFTGGDRKKTFFHGHSFTANPLACTAALASLDLLQNESCGIAIAMISNAHQAYISRLKSDTRVHSSNMSNTRCCGTILAFEFTTDEGNYLHASGKKIGAIALEAGILLRPLGNTIYVMPPYSTTQEELDKIYEFLDQIIEDKKLIDQ